MSDHPPASPESPPAESLSWTAHPLRDDPARGIVGVAAVLALATLVYSVADQSLLAGIGALTLLLIVLRKFFFVSRFRIDADGVHEIGVSGQRTLRWDEIRLCAEGLRSAWVSPLRRRSWREGRRGILLLFGRQRDAVCRELRRRLSTEVFEAGRRSTRRDREGRTR